MGGSPIDAEYIDLVVDKAEDFKTLKSLPINLEKDQEVINTVILQKLKLHADVELSRYDLKINEYLKKIERLKTVKQLKQRAEFFKLGGEGANYDTQSELSYGTKGSTKFSVVTGASGMSKRSKRPDNLALRKVKQGSLFEEEYLTETLNNEELSLSDKNKLRHFMDCLMMFGLTDKIEEVYHTVKR